MERGQQKGLISLRRKQMQAVEAGIPTMLIWMGKQLLGQKDKQELSGPNNTALIPLDVVDAILDRRKTD